MDGSRFREIDGVGADSRDRIWGLGFFAINVL